jgi:hypothetical protein
VAKHQPTVVPTDDGRWIGSCTCRWRAPEVRDTHQEAEDSNIKHLRDVARVQANGRRSTQSLTESRNYYRQQATEDRDPERARLWAQLADEIDKRLNDVTPPNRGQDTLF